MSFPLPTSGTGPAAPEVKKRSSILPAKLKPAVLTIASFGVLLVVVQLINSLDSYRLDHEGIVSRSWHGSIGILTAPLLHASWGHLLSNLVPLLIFGFLIMIGSVRQFVAVTVLVWLLSGLGVWLIGPANTYTIGASGLVFGWLAYLVCRGIFTRNVVQIAVGLVLLLIWGGIFWTGILHIALTGQANGVSWQGHLFGAIGGVLAAFLVSKADGPHRKRKPKPVSAAA